MVLNPTTRSLTPLVFGKCSREELEHYFLNTWELYETLLRTIRKDSYYYKAPDHLRHPLIFYLGHTACFYINKLKASGALTEGLNSRFEKLLAVGVDPESNNELETNIIWPDVEDVWAYREAVKKVVLNFINNTPLLNHADMNNPIWALHMAMEHERIHFETSSVLIRQYPLGYLKRPSGWKYAPALNPQIPEFQMVSFEGGTVQIGKPIDFPTYGWDSEYGQKEVQVDPFEIGNLMVSNGDFLEFVTNNGYSNRQYWSAEGWEWLSSQKMKHPKFWKLNRDGTYRYRAIFDMLDLPLDWPVEVTGYEAEAYLSWKGNGFRLMTEAEWKFATQKAPEKTGDSMFCTSHNLALTFGSPSPVGLMKFSCTLNGVYDLYGNVWDWLSDDFYPLPGYKIHPWYKDFSHPFMDEQHGMLAGGSWATSGTSASKYYRQWFRRGFFQHSGFRMARSL